MTSRAGRVPAATLVAYFSPLIAPFSAGEHTALCEYLMTLEQTLISVWQQALIDEKSVIEIGDVPYRAAKTSSKRLRSVDFDYGEWRISGIEQNPQTASRWADLARKGQRIMQFSTAVRYIGVVHEGRLTRYGAWSGLGLPD